MENVWRDDKISRNETLKRHQVVICAEDLVKEDYLNLYVCHVKFKGSRGFMYSVRSEGLRINGSFYTGEDAGTYKLCRGEGITAFSNVLSGIK